MRRLILFFPSAIVALTALGIWLVPLFSTNSALFLLAALLSSGAIIALVLAAYRAFRTFRGLAILAGAHIAAQVWLQWQWDLLESSAPLFRNLNLIAILAIWLTLIAMLTSLILLLVFRDASVHALAVGWVGYPLFFIATAWRYSSFQQLDTVGLRDQIVTMAPLCLLPALLFFGGVGFFAHLLWQVVQEIAGTDIGVEISHS